MALTEKQQELVDKGILKIREWQVNPLKWVKDIFGDNIKKRSLCKTTSTGLSTQQENCLRQWGKLIEAKLKANEYSNKVHHAVMTEEEQRLSKKIGMSIMSGTGTGKDFTAALLIFHFLFCFRFPKLLCTANTQKQLKDVLWSECSKIMKMAKKADPNDPNCETELEKLFTWQSELIFLKQFKGQQWFARACTINAKASPEEQGETLAGRHEDYQLFVLDEASSIPEAVFKPVEGTLTGKLNLVLMIFNPTRSTGFAVRSQYTESEKWVTLKWNSEESELVTSEHIENLAKYGKDSNTYRIRVLGVPPVADSSTLIPSDWVQDAIERPLQAEQEDITVAGIDVGGGGDKSCITIRRGGTVENIFRNNSKDTMAVAEWVADILINNSVTIGMIDIVGIGRGVYDRLRQMGINVKPFDSRAKARSSDVFYNARAEAYWNLRKQFEEQIICIPDDFELINQFNSITYIPEQGNKIEKKYEIKKKLGHSPDEVDSIAIAFYINDRLYRNTRNRDFNKIDFKGVFLR